MVVVATVSSTSPNPVAVVLYRVSSDSCTKNCAGGGGDSQSATKTIAIATEGDCFKERRSSMVEKGRNRRRKNTQDDSVSILEKKNLGESNRHTA